MFLFKFGKTTSEEKKMVGGDDSVGNNVCRKWFAKFQKMNLI